MLIARTMNLSGAVSKKRTQVLVIGAGISGVVTAKCMRDAGFDVTVLERTGDVGGLWTFREKGYGVTSFTFINVSKHNYAFSDYPFPENTTDYPHHLVMAQYIRDYVSHFKVDEVIEFHTQVKTVQRNGEEWIVETVKVSEDEFGRLTVLDGTEAVYTTRFLAIASGHHTKPSMPHFPGQDTFTGKSYHAVDFKDVVANDMIKKKVLIIGIGNSAIDCAANAVTQGSCEVYISSRSGAWIVPNYVFGLPVDHYAGRLFLKLPWRVGSFVMESIIKVISGHPNRWNLNPKMHVLQTQPTVSPVIIHHIQRGHVTIFPNVQRIDGGKVYFTDGRCVEPDEIVYCTGYKVDVPYLDADVRKLMHKEGTNYMKLYKNVFCTDVGQSLAFIGFVQPASGGVLTMSETQARWWAELCKGNLRLPGNDEMEADIVADLERDRGRWYQTDRHTIQKDPTVYNDDISSLFGAKPEILKHPTIAWRLLLGSCGASQWRLQGPGKWHKAHEQVCRVPVASFIVYAALIIVFVALLLLYFVLRFTFSITGLI